MPLRTGNLVQSPALAETCAEECVTTVTGVCTLLTLCRCFCLFKRQSTSYKITC